MTIVEVKDNQTIEEFRKLPFQLYRHDPNWIPHIRQDVESVFDPSKNSLLKKGEAARWIMRQDDQTIGRIAAFINPKTAHSFTQPTGGIGFFECIEDRTAAFKLFDHAKNWLQERGMEAMDGPINFGEKERFWGLITKNFELPPYYGQNYNPEYYVEFFEAYGFKKYYDMYIYHRAVSEPLPEKFLNRAAAIDSNPDYSCIHWRKRELGQFMEDFRTIYNKAWGGHDGTHELRASQMKSFASTIRPIMDEKLSWFVYFKGEPVAFYLSLPEINEWFKKVGDNLNLIGKLKFFLAKATSKTRNSFGVVFGVAPEHQGKGLEGLIFRKLAEEVQETRRYEGILITWIGDFNPKMIRIVENLGADVIREMTTYRYLFDHNKPFERAPIIGG